MLISEMYLTDKYSFGIKGFIFYYMKHPEDKARGGAGTLLK